jgi:hypothetical protein
MKKYLISIFIAFLLIMPVVISSPLAAEAPKPAMEWHCLESKVCSDPQAQCSGEGVAGHRARLATKADDLPRRNQQAYVFACITTEEGNVCTTGNSQVDLASVGYDGVAKLKQSSATGGFEFQGLFRPDGKTPAAADQIKANSQGKLTVGGQIVEPLEWQDYTPRGVGRKWLALNLVDPLQIEMGTGGQQQGTFTFEGALSKCVAINWDPYGIVFDSQSLEPVAGVAVTLTKKRDNGQFTLVGGSDAVSIINPLYTQEDGAFSFFVPDGIYKLAATASNFIFPNEPLKLNPNYLKAYSDIYRGEEIVQKGNIEHRDIPIDAKITPYTAPIKLISYFPLLDKGTNTLILQGRVSHPLTTINVYAKKPSTVNPKTFVRTRIFLTASSDKQGKFDLKIDLNKLQPTEFVGDVEFIKSPLMKQEATPNFFSLEPIFNYVEGYAYDENGKLLINSTVGVYLKFSNKPAYETKTDEKGFFKISSEYLPAMTYVIKYTTPTGFSYATTTSRFIANNGQYLQTEKVNLYSLKNKRGQTFKSAQMPFTTTLGPGEQQAPEGAGAQKPTNIFLVAIILLLLTAAVATAGGLYLAKKVKS